MPEVVGKLYSVTVFPYMWLFLLGVFLSDNKDLCLRFMKKSWLPLFAIAYLVIKSGIDVRLGLYGFIGSTLSFMSFVGFAYRYPQLNIKTDVSYAVYVYHMVVVNVFIALGFVYNTVYLVLVFVITFIVAFASTKTIGAFGLKKKRGKGST